MRGSRSQKKLTASSSSPRCSTITPFAATHRHTHTQTMTVSSDRHDSSLPPALSVPSPSSPSAHRSSWACPAGTEPTSCAPRPPCSRQTCSTDPRARKSRTSQDPPETTCSTSPFIHRAGSSRISSLSPRIPVWRAAPLPGQPQQIVAEEGRHPVAAQQGPGPLVIVKATCDTFTHACMQTYIHT